MIKGRELLFPGGSKRGVISTCPVRVVHVPVLIVWKQMASNKTSLSRKLLNDSYWSLCLNGQGREMFYLTTHSTHFIYGYMASDIWLRTILIVRNETRCRHIGYSFRLAARVLLYASSHRQDNTYHIPVVEHWLERKIAQWVHPMKDRTDDISHHERTLYLWATSRSSKWTTNMWVVQTYNTLPGYILADNKTTETFWLTFAVNASLNFISKPINVDFWKRLKAGVKISEDKSCR